MLITKEEVEDGISSKYCISIDLDIKEDMIFACVVLLYIYINKSKHLDESMGQLCS